MLFLYETNFRLRKDILDFCEEKSLEICGQFSLELLKIALKKKTNGKILVEKNCSDLATLKELSSNITTYDKTKWKEEIQEKIIDLSAQYKKSSVGSYKYDLICIGSSTGGFPVVQKLVKKLRFKKSIIIICQHISRDHAQNLKDGLEKDIKTKFQLVKEDTTLSEGTIYLLGGDDYAIHSKYNKLILKKIKTTEAYHPSFNVLTKSLQNFSAMNTACIILSGLGNDGSKYLTGLPKQTKIIAQNVDESTAPYMPKAAIATGRVNHIYKYLEIEQFLLRGVE